MRFKYSIADVNYPQPSIAGDIENWFEDFIVSLAIQMIIIGIPLVIDIILLIVSIIKIRSTNTK